VGLSPAAAELSPVAERLARPAAFLSPLAQRQLGAGARLWVSANQFSRIVAGPIIEKGSFGLRCAVAQDNRGSA
jgi:hypothetical protein